MIQQAHFWVCIQRNQNWDLKELSAPPPPLIAVLFTFAKTLKQLKRPSTDKRIKKMLYINTMEYYYSAL